MIVQHSRSSMTFLYFIRSIHLNRSSRTEQRIQSSNRWISIQIRTPIVLHAYNIGMLTSRLPHTHVYYWYTFYLCTTKWRSSYLAVGALRFFRLLFRGMWGFVDIAYVQLCVFAFNANPTGRRVCVNFLHFGFGQHDHYFIQAIKICWDHMYESRNMFI